MDILHGHTHIQITHDDVRVSAFSLNQTLHAKIDLFTLSPSCIGFSETRARGTEMNFI